MGCTGTCTWAFIAGMWEVKSSSCSSGCVCVDAITTVSSPFHDATDPIEIAVASGRSLAGLLELYDGISPVTDVYNHVVTLGKPISKYRIASDVLLHRLKFMDGLQTKPSTLPLWKALDDPVKGNPGATTQITTAKAALIAYMASPAIPSTAVLNLPCGPPQQ